MRICLVAPVPPFRGGIAKYCYSLARELEQRHELLLLSYSRQYPEILYGKKPQTDPEVDPARIRAEFSDLSFTLDSANPLSWLAASRRIAAFRPDLVILPWWVAYWAPLYLFLLTSLKKKGIKVVMLCINVFEHEGSSLKNFLTRLVLTRVDALIVHSEQEKKQILAFSPGATVSRHLLPLFEYRSQKSARRDPGLNLLFFGFVRPYKGLDILLRTIALLKGQDLKLRIAGEFWHDKNRYLGLISELGISGQVELADRYIPEEEMGRYFSEADLVVLPYRKSITSGIIATAYGYGKPVLATQVGGFHEVVQDGLTGRLVPPDDPQALADGIMWFMDHRQTDFEQNIAAFTSKQMSWASLVDLIETY
jgi:glycosyltransferase involved in cell wall biosynthesis